MSSSKKKAISKTIQFGIASLAGNAFMAFLVYKLIVKENPRVVTNVDMSLMIAIILLITMIEIIVFWSNQKKISERQHLFRINLEEILEGKKVPEITLEPEDPFYKLSKAVNEISKHEQHQIHVLTNQQNELKAIIDNLPVGVLVINRHRELQVANEYAINHLGITGLDVPHPYTMDIRNDDLKGLVDEVFQRRESLTKMIKMEADQSYIFETNVVYNPKVHHKFEIIVLLYDVTDRMRAKQVEQDFISNASHELRTPITSIAGFADTLLNGAKDDPSTLDNFLGIIKSESDKLVDLADDILTMSKVKNGHKEYKAINLHNYVNEQLKLMQNSIEQQELTVENNIPETIEEAVIENDLFQITKNLLTNAISYNKIGGKISINYALTHSGWKLTFTDTGVGIPMDQLERVFERFYRVNHTQQGGTGLGLAIVKEAVEDMNGSVRVESEDEGGTSVIVKFKRQA